MNASQTISVLNSLPFNNSLSDKSLNAINERIKLCGSRLRKLNNQVEICSGSTSPSSQRSYKRIYMQWLGNQSHDYRHKNCHTIYLWEFETHNKYGFHPLSKKAIFDLCDELEECINDLKGRKNPILKNTEVINGEGGEK